MGYGPISGTCANRFLGKIAALSLVFGVMGGCADEEPAALCFQVGVYAPAGHDPFTGVAYLRLSAESDGQAVGESEVVEYSPGGGAAIPYVPYGSDIQLVVEGWTAASGGGLGSLISRGKTVPVDCVAGQASELVTVMLTRINAFAQLTQAVSRSPVSLSEGRVGHTVTSTSANEVVVVGGKEVTSADATTPAWWEAGDPETFKSSIEVITGTDGSVRTHSPMFFSRAWHSATALKTGQVIIAGGYTAISGQTQALKRVEVYGPGTNGTVDVLQAELATPRAVHTATLVDEDSFTVLFVGGDEGDSGTFEVWNPTAGSTGAKAMPGDRTLRHHTATLFQVEGRPAPSVLIAGGEGADGSLSDAVFIYDAATDRMLELAQTLNVPRTQAGSAWIPSRNYVYIIGGYTNSDRSSASTVIDVFDIGSETLTAPGGFKLKRGRGGHSTVFLGGNSVLMVGGTDGLAPLDEVEIIYEYVDTNNSIVIDTAISNNDGSLGPIIPFLSEPRVGAVAARMPSGVALVVGGASTTDPVLPTSLNFYNPL